MQATTQYYVQAIGTLGPSGKVMIDITIESFPPDVVGTVDWIDRIASVGPEDTATEIVMSPDGGTAYVTGTIGDYYGEDYVTVAYDVATGYRRWVNQYDGPSEPSFGANGSDVSTAIAISPDGTRLYVTGNAALASAFKYQTIAIDTGTGQTVWASIHHMSGDENGNAWDIAVSPDGLRLYVTGQTGPPFHTDFTTIAYQASSGLELWAKSYDGPAHGWDHASQIAVTPGGKILVSGFSQGSDGFTDFLTIAYSVTGKRVWVKRLDVADDVPTAMALSQDGLRVFVTGETFEGSQSDALTVAYRVSDGAKLWAKRFTGPAGDDSARAIVVARDGSRVFVTGISAGVSTASDQFTLAYSAKKGKLQWNKRLTSAGAHDDSANAIVTSTDGTKLFVAGVYGSASSGGEFLISSYSATDGALLWTKALDGPGHGDDAGRTVLVAADGYRVFVGGSTTNATPDFTVAAFWAK